MGCGDPRSQKRDLGHPGFLILVGGERTRPSASLREETRRLLLKDGFGQVAWVVYVDSVLDGELVGEELQGHYLQHGG